MAGFSTPQFLTKYEFCTLAYDRIAGHNLAVVKRSGAGLAAGEHGDHDRLLQLLGESGWSCCGQTTNPDGTTSLLFQRPITISK